MRNKKKMSANDKITTIKDEIHKIAIEIGDEFFKKLIEDNQAKDVVKCVCDVEEFHEYELAEREKYAIHTQQEVDRLTINSLKCDLKKTNKKQLLNLGEYLEQGLELGEQFLKAKLDYDLQETLKIRIAETVAECQMEFEEELIKKREQNEAEFNREMEILTEQKIAEDLKMIEKLWNICRKDMDESLNCVKSIKVAEKIHAVCEENENSLLRLNKKKLDHRKIMEPLQTEFTKLIQWSPKLNECPNVETWRTIYNNLNERFQKFSNYVKGDENP